MTTTRKLSLSDISDQRAYERERPDYRAAIMQVRGRRRISLGPVLTIAFESRDTIRYQIQEMARAEKLTRDEDIQVELDAYNPLVPDSSHLCATLFLELTDEEAMRRWLPALVGIERHLVLRLSDGAEIRSEPEAAHSAQLTRDNVTSAVHYLTFPMTPAEVDTLATGGATLLADHPEYPESVELSVPTIDELLHDLLS